MRVPVIAFFGNRGGIGTTTLAYHLAWKLSDLGRRVLACDLDPQSNLTESFLNDAALEGVWEQGGATVFRSLATLEPVPLRCSPTLHLLPGDLDLSRIESDSSCVGLGNVIQKAASATNSEVAVIDMGPTLGVLNRAALAASDHLVIPVAPDIFSVRALMNLWSRRESMASGMGGQP